MTYPPNPQILGWWCSGEAIDGSYAIICAMVTGDNWQDAVKKDWPDARDLDGRPAADTTLSDRFPLSPWMSERIDAFDKAALAKPGAPDDAEGKNEV